MKLITGACDICKQEIKPAKDRGQLNRNLGWHKLTVHGIKGASATLEGKRAAARARHWKEDGMTPEQIAQREDEFQAKHADRKHSAPTDQPSTEEQSYQRKPSAKLKYGEPEPAGLTECCVCGARFYVTKPRRQ
jgi:hypothetical protein